MLTSSNEYSKVFLEKKRLLLDSCILIDWAEDESVKKIIKEARKHYTLVFCTVSMLEVGFGQTAKVSQEQVEMANMIYHHEDVIPITSEELHRREYMDIPDPLGGSYAFNPSYNEWFASRHLLIKVMEMRGEGGKDVRGLANDTIIYMSAWNSRSAIVTTNKKDFVLINKAQGLQHTEKHQLPFFSLNDLRMSFGQDVSFPENLASS